jgi:hypothetical protein
VVGVQSGAQSPRARLSPQRGSAAVVDVDYEGDTASFQQRTRGSGRALITSDRAFADFDARPDPARLRLYHLGDGRYGQKTDVWRLPAATERWVHSGQPALTLGLRP